MSTERPVTTIVLSERGEALVQELARELGIEPGEVVHQAVVEMARRERRKKLKAAPVVSRRTGEALVIRTSSGVVRVTIESVGGATARIGVSAPPSVGVCRGEIVRPPV